MTATAYAASETTTYNLLESSDGWTMGANRGDGGALTYNESDDALVYSGGWNQAYAHYDFALPLSLSAADDVITFSFDLLSYDYDSAATVTFETSAENVVMGHGDYKEGVSGSGLLNLGYGITATDSTSGYVKTGGWGVQLGGSFSDFPSESTVSTGRSYTISGEIKLVDSAYQMSIKLNDVAVATVDVGGDSFSFEGVVFSADGGQSTGSTLSNFTLTAPDLGLKNLTWNGGASGNWSDAAWFDSTTGQSFSTGDSVEFATADANITISGTVTPGSLTISENTTFSGTDYSVEPLVTVSVASDSSLTLSGTGILLLKNSSAVSGTISVGENAVLNISESSTDNALGFVSGTGTVVLSGVIDYSTDTRLLGNFTGTLEVSGSDAQLKLGGQQANLNKFSAFRLSNGATLGFWTGSALTKDITTLNGGTLDNQGGTAKFSGTISGDSLTLVGAGTTEFQGNVSVDTLNHYHGTLKVTKNLSSGSYSGVEESYVNSSVSVGSEASWSVTGDMRMRTNGNGNSTLTIDGSVSVGGTFELSYDGKTTVDVDDGGLLKVSTLKFGQGWGGEFNSSTGVYNKGSYVNVNAGGTLIIDSITFNNHRNSSELKLNGGTLGTSADTLTIDAKTTDGTNPGGLPIVLGVGTNSTINLGKYVDGAFDRTTDAKISIANAISGTGALTVEGNIDTKDNGQLLTLSGINTYTGGTTLNGARVTAGSSTAFGTGTLSMNGAVVLIDTDSLTVKNLNGNGNVQLGSNTTNSVLTIDTTEASTFDGNLISGDLSKTLALVKTGAESLTLSGSNYLGAVTVSEGALSIAGSSTLLTSDVTLASDTAKFQVGVIAVDDTTYEGISITGNLNLASGSKLIVDLTGVATVGESITLDIISAAAINLNWTETAVLTLSSEEPTITDFVELANADAFDAYAKTWNMTETGISLTLTIPEPSAFGLLAGVGALALVVSRRRRSRR